MLILLVAAMCAPAQSQLERAVTLARERRYGEARKVLDGAPEPAGAAQRIAFHRLKAAVASGLGEASNAAREMELALELAPSDPGLLLAAAVAESEAGRMDDALQHARAAGNSAAAESLIGDIEEKRGRYLEAARAYQAAVVLAPGQEQYRIALALELVQHHTFEAAIVVLKQAVPIFPKSARIRTLLGIAQYADGFVEDAIVSLAEAVALDPELTPARRYLVQVTLESTAAPPDNALTAVCSHDAVSCSALKIRVARERNDPALMKEGIAGLRRAPAGNATGRCELGRAYEWTEQWADARVQMEACVKLNPSPQNHYRLGRIYGHLGLAELAQKEMALRNSSAERLSDQVARRAEAVQAFEYAVK